MAMRDVMQGDEDNPKVPMENNCRLQMPINNRVVRTNINFQSPVLFPISRRQMLYDRAYTLCLKKVPTFKLTVTLLNLNRLSKILHCWKV